jgi:flagellar M-ring protein FliF
VNPLESLTRIWGRLSPNQKMTAALSALGVAAVAALVLSWAGRPDYQVLYTGLKPEDGGKIVDKLKAKKVPFQLRDGGGTVLVPSQNVYETRLALATDGLPHAGGVGYELFDKTNFGMTDFVQKLNFQRALEGELTRTIEGLDEVEQARIHVVIPEPRLYTEDKTNPTASVVLKLRGGGRLGQGQIKGITHLVASSVEGLKPEDVTIIDTNGNVLSKGHSDGGVAGLSSDQLETQQNVETYLSHKAQSMLEEVLGPSRAVVQVNAQLDFDKMDRTTERFDPDNQVVRSEEKNESSGASANEKSSSSVVNYEVTKSVEHLANAAGGVKKLTVAVMVDGSYGAPDKKGNRPYTARTPEEMAKIRSIVKNAVGIDAKRGDELEVANVAFDTSTLDAVQKDMKKAAQFGMAGKVVNKAGVAVVILVLFLLLRSSLKGVTQAMGPQLGSGLEVEDARTAELETPDQIARRRIEERVARLARERPQEVATLVRAWMREEI